MLQLTDWKVVLVRSDKCACRGYFSLVWHHILYSILSWTQIQCYWHSLYIVIINNSFGIKFWLSTTSKLEKKEIMDDIFNLWMPAVSHLLLSTLTAVKYFSHSGFFLGFWICCSPLNSAQNDTKFAFIPFFSAYFLFCFKLPNYIR